MRKTIPQSTDPRRYPQPLADGRQLMPGPAKREDRSAIRDNHLACVVSDDVLKGFEFMRKTFGGIVTPSRSSFLAHIVWDYVERHRRRDVPCLARKRPEEVE